MGKGKEKEKLTRMLGWVEDVGLREMVKGLAEELREMKEMMTTMKNEIKDIYQEVDGEYWADEESESGTDEESGEESDEEGLKRELYEEKTGLAEEKKVWVHWQLARV